MRTVWLGTGRIIMDLTSSWNKFWKERGNILWWHMYMKDPVWNEGKQGRKMGQKEMPSLLCFRLRGRSWKGKGEGEFGRARERVGRALLLPLSRVVSRLNSLPLPFRTPATQANCAWDIWISPKLFLDQLKLIGSWFPERSANLINSLFSRRNQTVAITISALFAQRQSRVNLMTFHDVSNNRY